MIRIYVNGQQLALKRDTMLTVEINNSLFSSPDIEGDISFSFTLPVEGNEQLLGFAHLPQIEGVKKTPCLVWCNNSQNWAATAVIQKTGHDSLSAALVINPYPQGFSGRSLTDNEDTAMVISESKETHNTDWERFLKASVTDPDVKFAPFFNEEGYGGDNEDYGYWNGHRRRKIVNALFFDPDGTLIDADETIFSKAHNERLPIDKIESTDEEVNPITSTYIETNQIAFCPQIRIARIMEIWCRNAGYKFINHLGNDLNATFLQSQKSLDATKSQFGMVDELTIRTTAKQWVNEGYHYCSSYALNGQSQDDYVHNGKVWLPYSGWWEINIDGDYERKLNNHASWTERVVMHSPLRLIISKGPLSIDHLTGETGDTDVLHVETIHLNDTKDFHLRLRKHISAEYASVGIRFALICKATYYDIGGFYGSRWQEVETVNLEIMFHALSYDQEQLGFNMFRSRFNIPELLPDVTNAAFLKTMLDTMGLCYFISAKTKTIEIVPFLNLRNSTSLDLTAYELTRETTTDTPGETLRTFRLKPLKDEDFNNNLRMEDVDISLPDAYANHEHLVLSTCTNTLYRAERMETSEEDWVEGWREYSGNPDRLELGTGEEKKHEPSVAIPHQRLFSTGRRNPDTDILSGKTPQLMVADFTISSDLYNTTEKPTNIILTQYRGFRQREYQTSMDHNNVKNEVMLPVWNNEFSLTANGANSLGEKYVKPVLELLGHRNMTYKFRLPTSMMQAVEDLLRPSELEPGMQTRFLIVRNVKTVPKKIIFQIDNGIDDTVLCQIEAVKVY